VLKKRATNEPTNDDGSFLSTTKDVKLSAENNIYSMFVKPRLKQYARVTKHMDIYVYIFFVIMQGYTIT
jgi:hypothetical protein